jgi:hypothetical protein
MRFLKSAEGKHAMLIKFLPGTVFAILLMTGMAVSQNEQPAANPVMNDLDEFMEKVMQKRRIDAENLRDYVFSEKETLDIKGSKIAALGNFRREYVWFVRDDNLVRSPVRIDGVKVSAKEQAAAEKEWIKTHKKKGTSLDREAFFGFKFEPGRYLYAGEQQFEGRKTVVVEYYPQVSHGNKNNGNKGDKNKNDVGGLFEKTFLVTMLIYPEEHQILRITFDNVGLEFLPGRWLARVNDIKASMVMDKPKGDIWLPAEVSAYGNFSAANMDVSLNYSREFYSYAKSDVKVKLWFGDMDEVETEK